MIFLLGSMFILIYNWSCTGTIQHSLQSTLWVFELFKSYLPIPFSGHQAAFYVGSSKDLRCRFPKRSLYWRMIVAFEKWCEIDAMPGLRLPDRHCCFLPPFKQNVNISRILLLV